MTDENQVDKYNKSFEKLFLKERKNTRIFIVVSALLFILLIGSVALNFQNRNQATGQNQTSGLSEFFGQNRGGFQGQRSLTVISDFFNIDGTVDINQVNKIKENIPAEFQDRFFARISSQIDSALKEGDITSDQSKVLKTTFGISDDTNTK